MGDEVPDTPIRSGAAMSLASAALFGVSAPLAKLLLPSSSAVMVAGLLYLGGGAGIALLSRATRPRGRASAEAPLARRDLPLLAGLVLLGGIVAPVLMLFGLARVSGVVGSLMLNLEMPLTIWVAVLLFGEHVSRRGIACMALVFAGATVLALRRDDVRVDPAGILALTAACACWALDNNLTTRLSGKDPVAITRVKCLVAGAANLGVAFATGGEAPPPAVLVGALLLGFVSYGVGLVLATRAMRAIGAARHSLFFASAPFVGAVAALPILGERLGTSDLAGMLLMVAGVGALFTERHRHAHTHEKLEHDHVHRHDDHHAHVHAPGVPTTEPHSHPHLHAPLTHTHAHASDAHHRHAH